MIPDDWIKLSILNLLKTVGQLVSETPSMSLILIEKGLIRTEKQDLASYADPYIQYSAQTE
jgi:hypothetical protein